MANNVLNQIVGQRFGKLTVLERAEQNSKSGNAMWICQCDCSIVVTVIGSHLRSGHTTSCGCNRISERSMGHSKDRLYRTWKGMHNRCYDPNHDRYKWYGGKGISICDDWHDFMTFRTWALANGYTDDLTIDRIKADGNYCPENCKWVDMKVQANNRSNNRILQYNGKKYTAVQLAESYGMSPHTVYNRLKLGWDVDQIVRTPERCES
jgi:hypothetical protein